MFALKVEVVLVPSGYSFLSEFDKVLFRMDLGELFVWPLIISCIFEGFLPVIYTPVYMYKYS